MENSDLDYNKAYEERLQRRLNILKQELENGKIHFVEGMQVIESIKAIRYKADGSVDLSTVDAFVRSLAIGIESLHDREELKRSISLSEIQNTYFEFLDLNFRPFFKTMIERKLTPHQAALSLTRATSSIHEITKQLPEFLSVITQFWESASEAAYAHVEDMNGVLKGIFGGDLFPSNNENIASKCGIYTDTLILPDPFLRSKDLFTIWKLEQQAYYLIKHALNLLQYKTLACADVKPPIVVILPDKVALDEYEKKFLVKLGEDDAIIHASKIFGRKFDAIDELMDYASTLDTVDKTETEIVDKNRILFDTEWCGDLKEQLNRAISSQPGQLLATKNPGIILASQAIGRMGVCNELLIKAQRLKGTPIIDAPTSWQYFVWKLEYDAENIEKENNLIDMHILRGLNSLSENEMEWLGRVPPAALIELRKTGALVEIRKVLEAGINELTMVNPLNFHRTTDTVFDNINNAFAEHKKNINKLKAKKIKFAGSDIGSWLVVGALAITSAATGLPVWGIAAVVADQLLDAPKLKDIPTSIKNLANESNKLKKSPVGILFKCSN